MRSGLPKPVDNLFIEDLRVFVVGQVFNLPHMFGKYKPEAQASEPPFV